MKTISKQDNSSSFQTVEIKTTWGKITLTLDDRGRAVALEFPSITKTPRRKFALITGNTTKASRPRFRTLEDWVKRFPSVETPAGTKFQQAVWNEIRKIPRGQTRTYGEIAAAIGNPNAVRAVGLACGANPLPIFIPCHRVVAKNGLGGFSGGLPWKRLLLETELVSGNRLLGIC